MSRRRSSALASYSSTASSTQRRAGANAPAFLFASAQSRSIKTAARRSTASRRRIPREPPWDRGDPFLTVGFALSAEAGSFLHVGWPFPMPAIDLYAEYMVIHNTEMSRGEDGKQPGRT